MAELISSRLLIVAPENTANKLEGILSSAGIEASGVYNSGEQALEVKELDGALVLTVFKLPDMLGSGFAAQAAGRCEMLMIVPGDYEAEEEEGRNVLLLRNPITPDALVQSVRTMSFMMPRMNELRKKAEKLERTLQERKVIERAKGRLMDQFGIGESEAHYRLQKKSMDSGRRIVDVAQEVLAAQELTDF